MDYDDGRKAEFKQPDHVRIYYDKDGRIRTIMALQPTGEFQFGVNIPGSLSVEMKLSGDLAKVDILELHKNYEINIDSKELRLRERKPAPS